MGAVVAAQAVPDRVRARLGGAGWWYAGAVLVGAALIVGAAVNQPYNQNELEQMAPYGSNDLGRITSGTRQPPLDPLLGALVQHLLGEGQLRQRLVPVLAGIGTLAVFSLLLRRLGLGGAGAFGVLVLATAPLMVRYSAYTRPYALPLFLMMLFVYAAQLWLDSRRRRWLVVAAVAAVALPLTRVPEPTVFLLTAGAALAWFARTGRRSWSQVWPLVGIALGALVFVGYPMFRSLQSKTGTVFDPSPSGFTDRFGSGSHEFATSFLPLLGTWFPWWPVTVLLVVTGFAVPASRRHLLRWWAWWPLLAAPVVFALAYHFLGPDNLETLPYRPRFAYFFLPPFVLVVVALVACLRYPPAISRRLRLAVSVLLGATLLGQLPATAGAVLTEDAPDFGEAAQVLADGVPADAIVLYDSDGPLGARRLPFLGKPRYLVNAPFTVEVSSVAQQPQRVPRRGPVYVLILQRRCRSAVCGLTVQPWDHDVRGWRASDRFGWFTLYRPTQGQAGRSGAIAAMRAFARAMGPALGYPETFAAAALLKLQGRPHEGKALIRRMYATAGQPAASRIRDLARRQHLDPFG